MWTRRRMATAALIWVGLALISATERSIALADRVPPVAFATLLRDSLIAWGSCAVFTPVVMWLVDRYPLLRGRWPRHLPHHLIALAVLVIARYALLLGLLHAFAEPPRWTLGEALRRNFASEAIAFAVVFVVVHAVVLHDRLRDEQLRALTVRAELTAARLDALVHKIEPHFLFNTLQAVSTLLHRDPRAADAMLTRLSALLRELLRADAGREVPLAAELETARGYLAIMAIRFADRLTTRIDVPAELATALVPRFVLQPLLENAIRHGVSDDPRGGRVEVTARQVGESLHVSVSDSGGGADAGGAGIGLANTRERLRTLYGDAARLDTGALPGGGFRATVQLPMGRAA